jgi:hypothetical protein
MWHEKSHCHINKSALPSQLKSDFADVTMTISVKKSIEGSKINFSILQEGINNFFFKELIDTIGLTKLRLQIYNLNRNIFFLGMCTQGDNEMIQQENLEK